MIPVGVDAAPIVEPADDRQHCDHRQENTSADHRDLSSVQVIWTPDITWPPSTKSVPSGSTGAPPGVGDPLSFLIFSSALCGLVL